MAVVLGDIRRNWSETAPKIRAVAIGLVELGLEKGDTVSVLDTLSTRLEAETIAYNVGPHPHETDGRRPRACTNPVQSVRAFGPFPAGG